MEKERQRMSHTKFFIAAAAAFVLTVCWDCAMCVMCVCVNAFVQYEEHSISISLTFFWLLLLFKWFSTPKNAYIFLFFFLLLLLLLLAIMTTVKCTKIKQNKFVFVFAENHQEGGSKTKEERII